MTTLDLTFKQNGAPYWDFAHWQGNPANKSRQVQFIDRPRSVFGSTRVFRAECIQGDNWPQSSGSSAPRCLVGAWTGTSSWYSGPTIPWPKLGERYISAVAIEVLPGQATVGTLWELHQSNGLSALGAVAPLSLSGYTDGWLFARLCGGLASGGNWQTYWNLQHIAPITTGVHMIVYDVKYSLGRDGYLDVYHALDQDSTFTKVVSKHTGEPTWPHAPGYEDEHLYQETGIYPDGSVPASNNAVCHWGSLQWLNAQDADLDAAFASFQFNGGTPAVKPVNSVSPVVTGTAIVGKTLVATTGTWLNGVTGYAYQWQLSSDGTTWADLAQATSDRVTLSSSLIGLRLRAVVTASNTAGSASAVSEATPVIEDAPIPTPTNAELRDQAVQHLQATTITYADWKRRVDQGRYTPPDGSQTEWGKAFGLLDRIT